ncbi:MULTISPECIES: flagellar biosynthesis protein FliQ [Kiloniella]|uniref:Flagellar biosynthetic protein FliQ n=2 Tax=Kiloniella TaxID=454159 RepID=A0A0M2RA97_9PROT|nr:MULTISPECIES: flagellar biosynthesis protein FliQ [Kiloniella]KKJ76528.1 flagellar biosynthesis protein FliQ [Kiloniella litopenaei]KLN60285.1 flagellar biosynthesis protein FliQ [Kiloniella spongiae]
MSETDVIEYGKEAVWVMLKMSAPVLSVALLVGLIISLFQALTQLQEMTLTFVPKLIIISLTLVATAPFMAQTLGTFTEELMDRIVALG